MAAFNSVLRTLTCFCVLGALINASADMNDKIDWVTYTDFKKMNLKENDKPVLYVLTQPWCGACKRLKETFVSDGTQLVDASKQYLMVSVSASENDGLGSDFTPDGGYIPRVFFADKDGKPRSELTNPSGNKQYKYFYTHANQLANAMKAYYNKVKGAVEQEL